MQVRLPNKIKKSISLHQKSWSRPWLLDTRILSKWYPVLSTVKSSSPVHFHICWSIPLKELIGIWRISATSFSTKKKKKKKTSLIRGTSFSPRLGECTRKVRWVRKPSLWILNNATFQTHLSHQRLIQLFFLK